MTGRSTVARAPQAGRALGRSAALGLVALVAALHLGCVVGGALDVGRSAPSGTIEVASGSLGDHAIVPSACLSGERQMFLGADFLDGANGLAARLIVEPTGRASLRVFPAAEPLDEGASFRKEDCDRFDLSLERTGWQVNEVYDLRVRLDVDCRASNGDSVRGVLAADHCH